MIYQSAFSWINQPLLRWTMSQERVGFAVEFEDLNTRELIFIDQFFSKTKKDSDATVNATVMTCDTP